jgi:hypothetical protein
VTSSHVTLALTYGKEFFSDLYRRAVKCGRRTGAINDGSPPTEFNTLTTT